MDGNYTVGKGPTYGVCGIATGWATPRWRHNNSTQQNLVPSCPPPDPCNKYDYYHCSDSEYCGWCRDLKRCISGTFYTPSGDFEPITACKYDAGNWSTSPCAQYGEATCTGYPNCGYCSGGGINACIAADRTTKQPALPEFCPAALGALWSGPTAIFVSYECQYPAHPDGELNLPLINTTESRSCSACLKYGCEWCPALKQCGGNCPTTINNKIHCDDYKDPELFGTIGLTIAVGVVLIAACVGIHYYLKKNGPQSGHSTLMGFILNRHAFTSIIWCHPQDGYNRVRRMFVLFVAGGIQLTITYIILSSGGLDAITTGVVSGAFSIILEFPITKLLICTGRADDTETTKRCCGYSLLTLCVLQFLIVLIILVTLVAQAQNLEYTFDQVTVSWVSSIVTGWAVGFPKAAGSYFVMGTKDEELYTISAEHNIFVECCCAESTIPKSTASGSTAAAAPTEMATVKPQPNTAFGSNPYAPQPTQPMQQQPMQQQPMQQQPMQQQPMQPPMQSVQPMQPMQQPMQQQPMHQPSMGGQPMGGQLMQTPAQPNPPGQAVVQMPPQAM